MNKNDILKKIEEVAQDVLDLPELKLEMTSTVEHIDEWDSLAHINIISQLEKTFSIKFTLSEIAHFSSIGKLVDAIENKKPADF